jgi:hypothetical protein
MCEIVVMMFSFDTITGVLINIVIVQHIQGVTANWADFLQLNALLNRFVAV